MYFDGQTLEAESQEDEDKILEALRNLGDLNVVEVEHGSTVVQVKNYSFIIGQGNMDFVSLQGNDDESDEMLFRLFLECGGSPDDIQ